MKKLGKHHFAHLRSVAEGLDITESARRFLAIGHAAEVAGAHREVVDLARAVARRRGDPRWRLIGLQLEDASPSTSSAVPTLQEWAAAEGLEGWSEAELQEMYVDRFRAALSVDSNGRRAARNRRLRERRLELLQQLEATAAEQARPTDLVDGWFEPGVAELLRQAGYLTLGDLQRAVARGGRWWSGLHAIGPAKAARLARYLAQLLPPSSGSITTFSLAPIGVSSHLAGATGINRRPYEGVGTQASNDMEAIGAWIEAKAPTKKPDATDDEREGSEATRRLYRREAERFMLFCMLERGKAMSAADSDDCAAYKALLAKVPDRWISKRNSRRHEAGWAPFRGQLRLRSRQVALDTLNSLFTWLVKARYLVANPWVLVNRKLGDDPLSDDDPTSRAFTPEAWAALKDHLKVREPGPSTARLRWICDFTESVGLRSDELVQARRQHLVERTEGWLIKVVRGKGGKNRWVPVPRRAIEATRVYFASRGLDFDSAEPDVPLLASTIDGMAPVTYASLYETFKRFLTRALRESSLPVEQRLRAQRASTHWLRHTYATRSAEAGVATDIIQENLGQADPRTAAKYARAQITRRQAAMEKVFGGGAPDEPVKTG